MKAFLEIFLYRHARTAPLRDLVAIATAAYGAWFILFRDKVTAKKRERVLDRFPPTGHRYFGHEAASRIPIDPETGSTRLAEWEPQNGPKVQERNARGPVWLKPRDSNGNPVFVEDPVSGAMLLEVTNEKTVATQEPAINNIGQWVIVTGSALGNFLICPVCPRFWFMMAAATVYEANQGFVVTVGTLLGLRLLGDLIGRLQAG